MRFLVRTLVYLISAAIGVLVATAILTDMTVHWGGFLIAIVVFAAAQLILGPLITKIVAKNAQVLLGGVGLLSTFVALLLATLLNPGEGISITGVSTWVGATVIVWLVTALATLVVPFALAKLGLEQAREKSDTPG